jgi:hypothetical protein
MAQPANHTTVPADHTGGLVPTFARGIKAHQMAVVIMLTTLRVIGSHAT